MQSSRLLKCHSSIFMSIYWVTFWKGEREPALSDASLFFGKREGKSRWKLAINLTNFLINFTAKNACWSLPFHDDFRGWLTRYASSQMCLLSQSNRTDDHFEGRFIELRFWFRATPFRLLFVCHQISNDSILFEIKIICFVFICRFPRPKVRRSLHLIASVFAKCQWPRTRRTSTKFLRNS